MADQPPNKRAVLLGGLAAVMAGVVGSLVFNGGLLSAGGTVPPTGVLPASPSAPGRSAASRDPALSGPDQQLAAKL